MKYLGQDMHFGAFLRFLNEKIFLEKEKQKIWGA